MQCSSEMQMKPQRKENIKKGDETENGIENEN